MEANKRNKKDKFNVIMPAKIKYFRESNGYTNELTAEELGIQTRAFFYKAKGETDFSASEIWILTKLFNCSLDDLIKEEADMTDSEKEKYREVLEEKYINEDSVTIKEINALEKESKNNDMPDDETTSKKGKFNIISGRKIKDLIESNLIKIEKVAEDIGKDKRTYFNKIKGRTEFTATEIWILTKKFDCSLDDLIKKPFELSDFEKNKYREILETSEKNR